MKPSRHETGRERMQRAYCRALGLEERVVPEWDGPKEPSPKSPLLVAEVNCEGWEMPRGITCPLPNWSQEDLRKMAIDRSPFFRLYKVDR